MCAILPLLVGGAEVSPWPLPTLPNRLDPPNLSPLFWPQDQLPRLSTELPLVRGGVAGRECDWVCDGLREYEDRLSRSCRLSFI